MSSFRISNLPSTTLCRLKRWGCLPTAFRELFIDGGKLYVTNPETAKVKSYPLSEISYSCNARKQKIDVWVGRAKKYTFEYEGHLENMFKGEGQGGKGGKGEEEGGRGRKGGGKGGLFLGLGERLGVVGALGGWQADCFQRVKMFNVIILSFALTFVDSQKQFMPQLGQTLQAMIGNIKFYCQQISVNPSITYLLLIGQNFKLYAYLQPEIEKNINKTTHKFKVSMTLEFIDGIIIKGFLTKVNIKQNKNGQKDTYRVYSFCQKQNIVSCIETQDKDKGILEGNIGKMNYFEFQNFLKNLNETNSNYQELQSKYFEQSFCKVKAFEGKSIYYNDLLYFDYNNQKQNKFYLRSGQNFVKQFLLPSDSTLKKDGKQLNFEKQILMKETYSFDQKLKKHK